MTESKEKPTAIYQPQVFDVANIEQAKSIILTNEGTANPEERWAQETPVTTEKIVSHLHPDTTTLVLDFGCGIGRLSKALIDRVGCTAIGIDISSNMRILAPTYVASPRFSVLSPNVWARTVDSGLKADIVVAAWVLQHVPRPADDIDRIYATLRPGGHLFVVNETYRCVPTDKGWIDDGVDLLALLRAKFKEIHYEDFTTAVNVAARNKPPYCRIFRKISS